VIELALPVSYWWDCCLFLDGEGRGGKGREGEEGEEGRRYTQRDNLQPKAHTATFTTQVHTAAPVVPYLTVELASHLAHLHLRHPQPLSLSWSAHSLPGCDAAASTLLASSSARL